MVFHGHIWQIGFLSCGKYCLCETMSVWSVLDTTKVVLRYKIMFRALILQKVEYNFFDVAISGVSVWQRGPGSEEIHDIEARGRVRMESLDPIEL